MHEGSTMKGMLLAGIFFLLSGQQAFAVDEAVDETMPAKKFLEPWQEQPKLPRSWQEIHRTEGRLTKAKEKDVFILAVDDCNLMLFWFRKGKTYWDMIVLAADHL